MEWNSGRDKLWRASNAKWVTWHTFIWENRLKCSKSQNLIILKWRDCPLLSLTEETFITTFQSFVQQTEISTEQFLIHFNHRRMLHEMEILIYRSKNDFFENFVLWKTFDQTQSKAFSDVCHGFITIWTVSTVLAQNH